jgi:glucosamine--fructose-6-phosphate aminotransferase (isomerizing)
MSVADQPAGALMAREIAEQPDVLERLLRDGADAFAAARGRIERFAPRFVLLAARGTSDHAALYAKYLVETRLGLPAGLVSPSTLTLYGARPDLADVLFVAVSQSGRSPDLLGSLTTARACGALTLAVTNDASSPLATAAELHVDVRAGAERAVAATKTYTAQLLALHEVLAGGHADLAALPEAAARTLGSVEQVAEVADRYRFATSLVTTARGYSYPTAREAALKVMETCYLGAQAFSGADLLHGPLAMIDAQVPVLAIATPGAGGAALQPVLDRLREIGADVVHVGGADGLPVATDGLPEEAHPIVEILPLQQLAWHMARARGTDPDRPRGLAKVTETW